jgi:uracil phosphoribosyltransferase
VSATATERLTHVTHPLVQHKLSYLREKDTPTVHFRKLVEEVTLLLTYEATKDFPTEDVEIETPLESATFPRIAGKKVAVCPGAARGHRHARRSALAHLECACGFIGMYRDEETLQPVQYFVKLPTDMTDRDAIVLDPMLATGNSSAAAIQTVKDAGARTVTLVSLVAVREGIERVHRDHPDVHIVCAAIDRGLNERGFIVPGLGDAGDRLYGTK